MCRIAGMIDQKKKNSSNITCSSMPFFSTTNLKSIVLRLQGQTSDHALNCGTPWTQNLQTACYLLRIAMSVPVSEYYI